MNFHSKEMKLRKFCDSRTLQTNVVNFENIGHENTRFYFIRFSCNNNIMISDWVIFFYELLSFPRKLKTKSAVESKTIKTCSYNNDNRLPG